MSYFLYGALDIDSDSVDVTDLAWRVSAVASASRLFVLLGSNVHQKPVLDVLQARGLLGHGYIPFFLSASPICDTSEELFAKDVASTEGPKAVGGGVGGVSDWLCGIAGLRAIRAVHVFTADGFDDKFDEVRVSARQFFALVIARIEADGELPSLCVRIFPTKEGDAPTT
jgi:hypothetical protein